MEYNSAIIPGGAFSLGRMQHGGGYCIGAIVETRMGLKEEKEGMTGSGKQGIGPAAASVGSLAGNGMRDVWVIGETFFRGVSGVFDVSGHRWCCGRETFCSLQIVPGEEDRISEILKALSITSNTHVIYRVLLESAAINTKSP